MDDGQIVPVLVTLAAAEEADREVVVVLQFTGIDVGEDVGVVAGYGPARCVVQVDGVEVSGR